MLPLPKKLALVALLAAASQTCFGFSLGGPGSTASPSQEPFQVQAIGYALPTDVNTPKNLGEEYRHNTPVMFYAFDANFLDFFGSNGMAAVDQAFGFFNALTNASAYSPDLHEVSFSAQGRNYLAESLLLWDLKSLAMNMIIENLGLADPVRYTWSLHNRVIPPGAPPCPFGETYLIIRRNFDPTIGNSASQSKISSYVNGVLYTYEIVETCAAGNPYLEGIAGAAAVAFPVDPDATLPTAVAQFAGFGNAFTFNPFGFFFTGLTADDVGGLRYLLQTNNMNIENTGPGTFSFVTDTTTNELLFPSNLTLLAAQSLTNGPGVLAALYPNLLITSVTNIFTNVATTNVTAYFTNFPWSAAGSLATLAFATNVTVNVQTLFHYTFGNIVGIKHLTNGFTTFPIGDIRSLTNHDIVSLQTVSVSNAPWAPAGSTILVTNVSSKTFTTNEVSGDFYIVPTNLCDFSIIAPQLTNLIRTTNVIVATTNFSTATNINGQSFTQSLVFTFTNVIYAVHPVVCPVSPTNLTQGVEKITFIKTEYDSLVGRFFAPITNEYIIHVVTNSTVQAQRVQRVLTVPDFLLTAASENGITAGPATWPDNINTGFRTVPRYDTNSEGFFLAGPGTITTSPFQGAANPPLGEAGSYVGFNKDLPIYFNAGVINTNAFLTQVNQTEVFALGSFDATTNPPVIYPNDLSINSYQYLVLVQVTPQYLPDATVGSPYSAQLQAASSTSGFQPPFTWSLAPSSPGLPPGLTITSGGLISGVPSQQGFFDFVIRVTDTSGKPTDRNYSIRVNP